MKKFFTLKSNAPRAPNTCFGVTLEEAIAFDMKLAQARSARKKSFPNTSANSMSSTGNQRDDIGQSQNVPHILKKCIQFLHKEEVLMSEGIFRKAGSIKAVKQLSEDYIKNPEIDFATRNDPDIINTVASLLKSWLRDVSGGIIPVESFVLFQELLLVHTSDSQSSLEEHLRLLSPIRQATIRYLLQFLKKVIDYQEVNKMTEKNLAIVFGPTLFKCPSADDPTKSLLLLQESATATRIMEVILNVYEYGEVLIGSGSELKEEKLKITTTKIMSSPTQQEPPLAQSPISSLVHETVGASLFGKPRPQSMLVFESVKPSELFPTRPKSCLASSPDAKSPIGGLREALHDELKAKLIGVKQSTSPSQILLPESPDQTTSQSHEEDEMESPVSPSIFQIMKSKPRGPKKMHSATSSPTHPSQPKETKIDTKKEQLEQPTVTGSSLAPKKAPSRPAPPPPLFTRDKRESVDVSNTPSLAHGLGPPMKSALGAARYDNSPEGPSSVDSPLPKLRNVHPPKPTSALKSEASVPPARRVSFAPSNSDLRRSRRSLVGSDSLELSKPSTLRSHDDLPSSSPDQDRKSQNLPLRNNIVSSVNEVPSSSSRMPQIVTKSLVTSPTPSTAIYPETPSQLIPDRKLTRDDVLRIKQEYVSLREKLHSLNQEPHFMSKEVAEATNRYRELKLLIKSIQKPHKIQSSTIPTPLTPSFDLICPKSSKGITSSPSTADSALSPVKEALLRLTKRRQSAFRPDMIESMTSLQIQDEKRDVKEELLRLKKALAENKGADTSSEDKTALKALYVWYTELKQKSSSMNSPYRRKFPEETSSPNAGTPSTAMIMSPGTSSSAVPPITPRTPMSGFPDQNRLNELKSQKRILQIKLHEYQDTFLRQHGHPVQSTDDWAPVKTEYKQYKAIRRELEKLSSSPDDLKSAI